MNQNELFPPETVAMDSPKLAWLKRYQLITEHDPEMQPDTESPETGENLLAWVCFEVGKVENRYGYGNTEDEAYADFAIKAGISLWNEETKPPKEALPTSETGGNEPETKSGGEP